MYSITPILLAGGNGARLWPSSRKNYPKQFIKFNSEKSLFQQSVLRLTSTNIFKMNPQIVITNDLFRFIVIDQLKLAGADLGTILIEPEAKNTAAAIIASTIYAMKDNKDAIVIAAPSDHVIPDTKYFKEMIKLGIKAVGNGKIVTLGINPSHIETGYGYLKIQNSDKSEIKKVIQFIEKPDLISAKKMLNDGNYLWNSGIFMYRAKDIVLAFQKHASEILFFAQKSLELSVKDNYFIRLNPKYWKNIDDISIDYAIMEKVNNLVAVPYLSKWSDLGNWDAVWRESQKDKNGVVFHASSRKHSY